MKMPRAGLRVILAVGAACLVLSSEIAQAQVKLQYKFPEGKKLTYKTTEKIRQISTLMGMGDRNRGRQDDCEFDHNWKAPGGFPASGRAESGILS